MQYGGYPLYSLPYNCSPPLPQPLKSRMQGGKKVKKGNRPQKISNQDRQTVEEKHAIKKSCMCPVPDIPAAAGFQRVIQAGWTPASPCSEKGLCQGAPDEWGRDWGCCSFCAGWWNRVSKVLPLLRNLSLSLFMCPGQAVLKKERASEIHLKGKPSAAPLRQRAHLCLMSSLHSSHSVCLRSYFTTNAYVFGFGLVGKEQGSAPTVRLLRPWDCWALHVCITFNQTLLNPCSFILPKGWCKSRVGFNISVTSN